MPRSSWDEYYMELAEEISTRATCNRLSVGCLLVKDNRVIATGYNGSVSGHPHCDDVGHLEVLENGKDSCKRTIHAEMNALLQCAKYGVSSKGAVAYVTHYPCPTCMQVLNQAGIEKVVYKHYYEHRYKNNFHIGMEVVHHERDN